MTSPCRTRPAPPPVGGGLRPAPQGPCSAPIFVGSQTPLPPRRGGPMCPPGHAFLRDLLTGQHTGRPLQILLQHPSTSGQWAGTEPRPYSRRMPNAGSRSTGPSSTSSPASQNARNDSRHQSLHLPSPVPTSFVPESPVTPGWFPKEGPQPFLWSFQGGRQGGHSKSPLTIFLGKREGIFF